MVTSSAPKRNGSRQIVSHCMKSKHFSVGFSLSLNFSDIRRWGAGFSRARIFSCIVTFCPRHTHTHTHNLYNINVSLKSFCRWFFSHSLAPFLAAYFARHCELLQFNFHLESFFFLIFSILSS